MRRILDSGEYDTVLAYYNLLNQTPQEPSPTGADIFDNGEIIPLAISRIWASSASGPTLPAR